MASNAHNSTARAILYAFIANFCIAIAKTWAAMFTGSGSMLAEAIHSYADTGNQMLLYMGLTQAKRPPDKEHPLGYGKLSYFWSFIVAILLFSLGGLFSIYEACTSCNTRKNCLTCGLLLLCSYWRSSWRASRCLVRSVKFAFCAASGRSASG